MTRDPTTKKVAERFCPDRYRSNVLEEYEERLMKQKNSNRTGLKNEESAMGNEKKAFEPTVSSWTIIKTRERYQNYP
jgi:hypothetical protein